LSNAVTNVGSRDAELKATGSESAMNTCNSWYLRRFVEAILNQDSV
jgi:hypothetical protein